MSIDQERKSILSEPQRTMLIHLRAWQAEGERRYEFWAKHEARQAALKAFGEALVNSGLRTGKALSEPDRTRLLRLASTLAPNANLSRRLYTPNPSDFDRRLRTLLYGTEPLEERLRIFLSTRGTGAPTASQLLCAFAPETYPLVSRIGLRRLKLTAGQKRTALSGAAERYGFVVSATPDAAQRLLALFVIYEEVRTILGIGSFLESDALLRAEGASIAPSGLAAANAAVVRESNAAYKTEPPALTESTLLATLEEFMLGQGFTFPTYLLRSYYVALKTKPFAILSGVSGTGKTKMAELFAEALTSAEPRQFRLIPVRPDWTDSSALFGYQNVMSNRYVSTPFLEIVRTAALPENRDKMFFVCLDEMNLARVEHYLADYLSALESRAHRIPLHESVPDLVLSPNLFVTGTVNVDETTHLFSQKVLDRTNTLDFDEAPTLLREIDLGKGIASLEALAGPAVQRQALFLRARLRHVGQAKERLARIDPMFPARALAILQALNDRLYPHHLHFGYRVRDEALLFLAHSFDGETDQGLFLPTSAENFALALDIQVKQKALPKINGVAEQLEGLLTELIGWAEAEALPLTTAKLVRMRARGRTTGYVRFYD